MTNSALYRENFRLKDENASLRKEQSNMRSHLQKWHRIFIEVDNDMISPKQCREAMEALWDANPYED